MTLKHHQQRAANSISALLKKYTYVIPALILLIGFLFGAMFIRSIGRSQEENAKTPKTITFLMYDGSGVRTWNGVSVYEGESIASILDRMARTENLGLGWSGTGRDRQITSLGGKEVNGYVWKAFINNAPLPTSIGKFYPKPGDNVTLIYTLR